MKVHKFYFEKKWKTLKKKIQYSKNNKFIQKIKLMKKRNNYQM